MLRYVLESPYGRWTDDGSRFVYQSSKVAEATGYTREEVDAFGPDHCVRFPRSSLATNKPSNGKR